MAAEKSTKIKNTVSVVIATFNGENYIQDQLKSILLQKRKPDEIILVDDCSTDNTVRLVDQVLQDSEIHYRIIRHKHNEGVNQAFIDGIEASDSEFVMLCDQDDYWNDRKIDLMIECFDLADNIVLAVCNASITDEELKPTGKNLYDFIGLKIPKNNDYNILCGNDFQRMLLKRNYVTGMCMAIKKECFKYINIPKTVMYDYWIAWLASLCGQTVFIDKELVLYRQHSKNVVGAKRKDLNIKKYYKERSLDKKKAYQKYLGLTNLPVLDNELISSINEAVCFYYDKVKMDEITKKEAMSLLLSNLVKRNYEKYHYKPAIEFSKDLVEILLFHNKGAL